MKKTGNNFKCETCNNEFYRSGWQIKRNQQKFCSLGCRRHTKEAIKKMSVLKQGKPSWNKGLTKITDSRLDYKRPTVFINQGKSTENQLIRKSARMRWWRKHVFERDDYTCQACGEKGGRLNADHVLPFSSFPDLRFEILNGRTLCEDCHRNTDTFGQKALSSPYANGTNYYGVGSLNFS